MIRIISTKRYQKLIKDSRDLNAISYDTALLLGLVVRGEPIQDNPLVLHTRLTRLLWELQHPGIIPMEISVE